MIKTLIPIGEGLGIVIDRSLLEQLSISTAKLPLRITSDGKGFYVEPIPTRRKEPISSRPDGESWTIHDEAFRKLAD